MKRTALLTFAALSPVLSAGASAQTAPAAPRTPDAWTCSRGDRFDVVIPFEAPVGERCWLFYGLESGEGFNPHGMRRLTSAVAGAGGRGAFQLTGSSLAALPEGFGVKLFLVHRAPGGVAMHTSWLPLRGQGGTLAQVLDANFKPGDVEPVRGEPLGDQWQASRLAIDTVNNDPSHPQMSVAFDSAAPTGGDPDLATPGYGVGNTEPLGMLMVIAENDVDTDGDGMVDDPGDEAAGGVMRFRFDGGVRATAATLVDIDDPAPTELRFLVGDGLDVVTVGVPNLGDNSVQRMTFDVRDVRAIEVHFGGSGALASLEVTSCPMMTDVSETPYGRPTFADSGLVVHGQFASLGMAFDAWSHLAGRPDKLTLFDTAAPTGDDLDLATPGYGAGNTEPLGKVFIIAENDVDADGDGLIDVPDDDEFGGVVRIDFMEPMAVGGTKVIDMDPDESATFTLFGDTGQILGVLHALPLGDNSVQRVAPAAPVEGVMRIEADFSGSGAFTPFEVCPMSNGF